MIIDKLEQDISSSMNSSTATSKPPVTLRIVVPASQCGSLIGKGGCKIKEIRESTGAQVQVAGDMLPNSTERAITLAGTPHSIIECVKQICVVMLESPPKGVTIPYRPKPSGSPTIFSGGQANAIQGQHVIPQPDLTKLHQLAMQQSPFQMTSSSQGFTATLDASARTGSHEMTIPNDLIGCVIGRQGTKINEIRQLSGAQIKITNPLEGSADRQVTITGSAASISVAEYLINASLQLLDGPCRWQYSSRARSPSGGLEEVCRAADEARAVAEVARVCRVVLFHRSRRPPPRLHALTVHAVIQEAAAAGGAAGGGAAPAPADRHPRRDVPLRRGPGLRAAAAAPGVPGRCNNADARPRRARRLRRRGGRWRSLRPRSAALRPPPEIVCGEFQQFMPREAVANQTELSRSDLFSLWSANSLPAYRADARQQRVGDPI
ncbi:hypothetical protein AOLI_G00244660 [Acnodon oligacanthus]